jgi:RNA polymerase sigma-70 factor (ECF subfamily)
VPEESDLELAAACAAGDAAALAALDALLAQLHGPLAKLGLSTSDIDEVIQQVRAELLVATADRPARIAGYAGRGPLLAWLRSVGVRKGLAHARARRPHETLDGNRSPALGGDPELAYMKKVYGAAFESAFADALAAMPAADRLLLKQRLRHDMGVEDLGRQHGVAASTITRRVQAARAALADDTRARMMSALGVGETEAASILRMIESQLEITLSTRER